MARPRIYRLLLLSAEKASFQAMKLLIYNPFSHSWADGNITRSERRRGISLRRPGFYARSVLVRFVVDKVALGQVFLQILRFSPVSIIPPILHTHLHLHLAITGRIKGRSLGTFQKAMLFRKSGSIGQGSAFTFFSLRSVKELINTCMNWMKISQLLTCRFPSYIAKDGEMWRDHLLPAHFVIKTSIRVLLIMDDKDLTNMNGLVSASNTSGVSDVVKISQHPSE
jgi:hypothetical protein